MVKLHILKLHESPVVDGDYERFRMMWLIDDAAGPPKADSSSSSSNSSWEGIHFGDLLFFPELQSGAGEFEGLRYAGERQMDDNNNAIQLLVPGVESIEFPAVIASMAEQKKKKKKETSLLRSMYEKPLQDILSRQGSSGITLADIYGGSEVVEEFWENPDVCRRRTPFASENDKWYIPLSKCSLIQTKNYEEIEDQ